MCYPCPRTVLLPFSPDRTVTNLLNPFNLFNPFNLLWPCHRSVNTTVTVMITATASPLSVVGVKVH
jgi:hypothetical protein